MRKIKKSTPPPRLVQYAASTPNADFNMPKRVKDQLKQFLLYEQGHVCGYCQQKITANNMKVEHHCDQQICNGTNGRQDRRLDYTNLLGVCKGNQGTDAMHCDSSKANFNVNNGLPIEVSPWNSAHMTAVIYKTSGEISSSNARHQHEINIVLNLNVQFLKEARSLKWYRIFKESFHENRAKQRAKMRKILESDLDGSPNHFRSNFPGLSEYMLSKFC